MSTLYIPSTLNSYFLTKLKKLPAVGAFTCQGERYDVIAYKIYGDMSFNWIIKYYNGITYPYDGSNNPGRILLFPSLKDVEELYATLVSKSRAMEGN